MKVLVRIFLCLGLMFVAAIILFAIAHRDRRPRVYFAAEEGDTNSLAQYLALGANVNDAVVCYRYGGRYAPLLNIAARSGQPNAAVAFLLKNGAAPNLQDSSGCTPLNSVIEKGESQVAVHILQILLKVGADPNLKSRAGFWTPLIEAADLGESEMVRVLLAAGADVHATNSDGLTAIHYSGNGEIARLLIAAGSDPSARVGGETPAESAVRLGHFGALTVITNAPAQTGKAVRP